MPIYRPLTAREGCQEWPQWYRVGDDGSVWTRRKSGRYGGIGDWRELRPVAVAKDRGGTLKIGLMRDGVKRRCLMVAVDVCVCRAFHGPRPIGQVPLHWPDPSPSNCRADNLRWAPRGTRQLGIDPRKGDPRLELRGARGHNPYLTDDQVIAAREACAAGQTAGDIAAELGVGRHVVDLAVRGKTYRDLPGAIPVRPNRARGTDVTMAKLDELAVMEIREARDCGESVRSLADRHGVGLSAIYAILQGRTWKHVTPEER